MMVSNMIRAAGISSGSEDEYDGFTTNEPRDFEEAKNDSKPPDQDEKLDPDRELSNLLTAIKNENLQEVGSILNRGTDINARLKDNWTPLMVAASIANSEITCELIARGADVNAVNGRYTALMAACSCPEPLSAPTNRLEVVTRLLDNGAIVNAKTQKRKTPLMFAAGNGNKDIILKLLDAGADLHAEDNQGWNALFWAVNDNQLDAVELLLKRGLSPNKLDIRGNRPADYATSQEQAEILKILSEQDEHKIPTFLEHCYSHETFLINRGGALDGGTKFVSGVRSILYGIKCEYLVNKLSSVGLQEFLCLTDEKLAKLKVSLPYQRNRVLTGLFDFHRHPFKQKSLIVIPKNSIHSTIDISNAAISIIRQLIIMEAGMRYVRINMAPTQENLCYVRNSVENLQTKLHRLKSTTLALRTCSKTWDSTIYRPDFITGSSIGRRSRWLKFLTVASVASLISISLRLIVPRN